MLHSWDSGLEDSDVGRFQLISGEAVNAYYSAALMGLAYNDANLVAIGSTLAALEIHAAQMWGHLKRDDEKFEEFTKENRTLCKENKLVGVLWSNKRDRGLWFAPPAWKEFRLGIQLLPLVPVSEFLFSNKSFVKVVVKWTMPALDRDVVEGGWKGFLYALQGVYDNESALEKIRSLKDFDNSRGSSFDDDATDLVITALLPTRKIRQNA
ncbi:hypothetical protein Ahy_A04g017379 [Arachis hypogaea]|uniref:glucan endo-1,3-beta-D-glucosidase n=1 Tax=Arachis hypogaea TaxID=3818 RepID=A0A445DAW2_ARAHY|nr:hypothetical protein Ahy_A04g017379 [Arachis hypogaea]